MTFEFDNFKVFTTNTHEQLEETYFKPYFSKYGTKPEGYKEVHKIREFTVFNGLNFKEEQDGKFYRVINDLFDFIDLIEVLKAFTGNKLDTDKTYKISDRFTAKIVQKNQKIYLSIHFTNYSNKLYLDKFKASSLSAKFSKILSRCEPWQELDQ